MCDEVLEEILCGTCGEAFGCSQCVWQDGNACYSIWKLAPCCGSPDVKGISCCLLNWVNCCCCWCACCKLYASSLHQECAWWPHICVGMFCCPCMTLFTRYNLRLLAGVPGNMCGDYYCCCCCPCCSFTQTLRSVDPETWRVTMTCPKIGISGAYYFL